MALFIAIGVYLAPLEPNLLSLQFAFTEPAFRAVLDAWQVEGVARYRAHFPADYLLLALYGSFGAAYGRRSAGSVAGRRTTLLVWALPMAALADAAENTLHGWLLADPAGAGASLYAVSGLAAVAKWLGILVFVVSAWADWRAQRAGRGAAGAMSPETLVREFWRRMNSNDFHSVRPLLCEDFVMHWPQSGERIQGGEQFARMNAEYPTTGHWKFQINRLVASGSSVVTQVSVTDGAQSAEPVSFFAIEGGRISQLTEYWPEPFAAPANRSHMVSRAG